MSLFSEWFLPLFSLREKSDVRADQLPALLRYFRRAFLAKAPELREDSLERIRRSIREGDTDWIMRGTMLSVTPPGL